MQRQFQPNDYDDYEETFDDVPNYTSDDQDVYDDEYNHHMMKLGGVLDFTPQELEDNRHGYLSHRQAERLAEMVRRDTLIFAAVVGVIVLATGLAAVPGLTYSLLAWLFFLIDLILIGGTAWVVWVSRQAQFTMIDREVHSATIKMGKVSLLLSRWGKDENTANFGVEGQKRLKAPSFLYDVMRSNQAYRAYYVQPNERFPYYRMVSMEPASPWTAGPEAKRKRKRG